MPTPTTARLPKPLQWSEFEDICADAIQLRWQDPHASRFGRSGQRQHGVDILGRCDGRRVAAQCKNSGAPRLEDLLKEATAAKTHWADLTEFVIMTTADRDTTLRDDVELQFAAKWPDMRGVIMFWEDIVQGIAIKKDLVRKHWAAFLVEARHKPVRIVEAEGATPKQLLAMDSGQVLLNLASDCDASQTGWSRNLSNEDNELAATFFELVTDWVDLAGDLDSLGRVRAAKSIDDEIRALAERGLLVFAARERRQLEGGVYDQPSPFFVLHLVVVQSSDASIVRGGE